LPAQLANSGLAHCFPDLCVLSSSSAFFTALGQFIVGGPFANRELWDTWRALQRFENV